ncbi:MAG: GGDEF domain-containing protein [Kiritimatiellae bacterium]|nr:GGDEF domain-containing protein [Kiritimatiellia bacterium]
MAGTAQMWTQIAVAFAAAAALLALGYSLVKYEWLLRAARSGAADLEPPELLALSVSRRLRRGRGRSGPFCVVLIRWRTAADNIGQGVRARRLRAMVRRTDDVVALAPDRTVVVLDAPAACAPIAVARWRAVLNEASAAEVGPVESFAGVAEYPADGESAEELLAVAERRADAAAAGGRTGVCVLPVDGAGGERADPAEDTPPTPAEQAMLDPVTGLLRADRMGRAARKFISNCRYRGRPVSVLHVDLDRLGAINERFGREAGDAVVRACADALSAALRQSDLLGRVGEDEFLAVLDCPLTAAEQVARRLIESARSSPARLGELRLPYGIRVGLAGIGGPVRPAHVLDAAAVAVQWLRRQGPGTWAVYRPEMQRGQLEERPVEDVW